MSLTTDCAGLESARVPALFGDSAPAAIIELVTEPVSPKKAVVKEAEAATKVAADQAPVEAEANEAEKAE